MEYWDHWCSIWLKNNKADKGCGHLELIPHSCKSRFGSTELVAGGPTCGKHATDVWANQVLNVLLDVPYQYKLAKIDSQLLNNIHKFDSLTIKFCLYILAESKNGPVRVGWQSICVT